jgi:FAD/FMN-containing dehydrogenase/Fe-S oxidoreductase
MPGQQLIKEIGRTTVAERVPMDVDREGLAADLQRSIEGEVRFDRGSRALYAAGGANYRQVPIGVVVPRSVDDIIQTVATCRRYGAPILSRGGGTSLAGQICNVAVVMDMSKYLQRIVQLDPQGKRARVQPGLVLDTLRTAAEQYHLTFAPDPSTHNHCTLGGMIGNNSCGVHALMGGKTEENTEELDILTYNGLRMKVGQTGEEELQHIIGMGGRRGEIYRQLRDLRDTYADLIRARYPKIPRRVSGYNLNRLLPEHGFDVAKALVGTEGTCVTILEATVRLVHSPPARTLVVLGYPDIYTACDHIMDILHYAPVGLEGMDNFLVQDIRLKGLHPENLDLLPEGGGWLLAEFGGETKEESDAHAQKMMAAMKRKSGAPSMRLYDDPEVEHHVWKTRESGLGATARVPGKPDAWEGWEDSAVPPERLGNYLRDLRALFNKYKYECALYGHFGQGCIHTRINFDFKTQDGLAKYRAFISEAVDLVVSYGGSLSGEHGDGQSRAEFLPRMFGNELIEAFREFKTIWDPQGKMNPHKIVDPYRIDENLRLGADYNPPDVKTHFRYPEDAGSFARTTLRCVGVGECRRDHGGTMCPSYRATREEMHSTRGRARLLFEMLEGDPLHKGWKEEHVHDALRLCLACKGCKNECPVNVDMATYKAEFLSHYYAGRLRPMHAYSMGLIYWWSRLASTIPGIANVMTQTPGLSGAVKAVGGIDARRKMPPFATQTFTDWFRKRPTKNFKNVGKTKIILWPDTFNNYFFPETAVAAVEVLEAAGFHVTVPSRPLCCGRPLYDFGMLHLAKHLWRQIFDTLHDDIEAGTPIVGLEPSCVAAFRDELIQMYPMYEDAKRLNIQVLTLAEFLDSKAPHVELPQLHRHAIVHGHCHQKAVMGFTSEQKIMKRIGLHFDVLDSGCCGMAGSFGFKSGDHYDVSLQVGGMTLLPAVQKAPADTLIMADGFSCREQIAQTTDRRALHLAQVMQMALKEGPRSGPARGGTEYPERNYFMPRQFHQGLSANEIAILAGAGLAIAGGLLWMLKRNRR